jgi:hypothetical protein
MNLCCIAFWKALRVSWTIVLRWNLDHCLLDVGIDASEHADEQLVAEHQCFGGHWLAVVVALVKSDHRLGHGGEQLIAGE